MSPSQILGLACIAAVVLWNAYESFRMRQHRRSTEYILHLVTIALEKMSKRQDVALSNDATIAKTLALIEQRMSSPASKSRPPEGHK